MPVVDESTIDAETETVKVKVGKVTEYQVCALRDEDGQPVCKPPVVTKGVNLIIDGMLDMLVGAGLVHWYWRDIEDLETDPGETAAEVRKNWPSDWTGESCLTMLEIS